MPNPRPIRQYIAAVEAIKEGNREKACELLASAVGATVASPPMKISIDKMLTPGTDANAAILKLVANQVSKEGETDV